MLDERRTRRLLAWTLGFVCMGSFMLSAFALR
jgi:hypothetical protein